MKMLLASSILVMASVSQADVIKCTFTEPFVDTVYSMTSSTLTYKTADGGKKVIKNVSFQIKGPSVFELMDKNGKVLQTLTLNYKGSNGMSDEDVYPYEVQDTDPMMTANNGIGGCSSNYQKVKTVAPAY